MREGDSSAASLWGRWCPLPRISRRRNEGGDHGGESRGGDDERDGDGRGIRLNYRLPAKRLPGQQREDRKVADAGDCDEAVAHLYDPWHPAVLALIANTIRMAQAAGKDVSVCGEMAGDPEFTEVLLSFGLRSFSMHPTQLPSIKQRILRTEMAALAGLADTVLAAEDPQQAGRASARRLASQVAQAG